VWPRSPEGHRGSGERMDRKRVKLSEQVALVTGSSRDAFRAEAATSAYGASKA